MGDRFHRAARDGSSKQGIELLKEATSRDLNRMDKEGMTPTLIAAEQGHLEAFQTCISRGGKGHLCDALGQTSLHLATSKGHLNIVKFISKYYDEDFVKILFLLDNQEMTAKMIATGKADPRITTLLDKAEANYRQRSPATVDKVEKKAQKQMIENKKRYEKVLRDQAKKQTKAAQQKPTTTARVALKGEDDFAPRNKDKRGSVFATIGKAIGTVRKKQMLENIDFSQVPDDYIDGTLTISGANSNVLFKSINKKPVELDGTDTTNGGRTDVRNIFEVQYDDEDEYNRPLNPSGLFSSGGFGQRIFFKQNTALVEQMEAIEDENRHNDRFLGVREPDPEPNDSNESELDSSDDDEEDVDPLETFLAALNLTEYWPLFQKERMDLEALMEATDADLQQIHLPKGPRIKILKSMESRRQQMEHAIEVNESGDTQF